MTADLMTLMKRVCFEAGSRPPDALEVLVVGFRLGPGAFLHGLAPS